LARQNFAKKPIWSEDTTMSQKSMERDLSMAQYTGGKVEVLASFYMVSTVQKRLNLCVSRYKIIIH